VGSDISIDVMWNKETRILTALALNSAYINIGNVYFGSYNLPVSYVCLLWMLELIQTTKIITQSAVCAHKEKWNIRGSSVRYGAGRGGFSLTRPRPYTGPGGVCFA